jgi:hypothetical protein
MLWRWITEAASVIIAPFRPGVMLIEAGICGWRQANAALVHGMIWFPRKNAND